MNATRSMMIMAGALAWLAITQVAAQCGGCTKPVAPAASVAVSVPAAPQEVNYITKEQLRELIKDREDLLIVDVLDAASFAKRRLAGAVNLPLGRIEGELTGYFAKVAKDRPIVVYCANTKCQASTKAAKLLMGAGFTAVMDYKGGLAEWAEAGLPVGSGEACPPCGKVKGQPGVCAKETACPAVGKAPRCAAAGCPGKAACPALDKAVPVIP